MTTNIWLDQVKASKAGRSPGKFIATRSRVHLSALKVNLRDECNLFLNGTNKKAREKIDSYFQNE